MSIDRRRRGNGKLSYRVRWREGSRHRVRTFDQLRDAQRFEIEVRRRKQLGEVGLLDAGRQTLDAFFEEWWSRYAEPNLSRKTLVIYEGLWRRRLSPALGHLKLIELTPETIESFAHDLQRNGVGQTTIQKSLVLLQGAMKKAVLWGRISHNPVAAVTKPSQKRRPVTTALGPKQIEALRDGLDIRDATLISVLGYAGLRPGEALGLRWGDVRERTLLIQRAVSLGEVKSTKTGAIRSVRMLSPVIADLTRWRLACGRPVDDHYVFPSHTGGPWSEDDYKNWRNRCFRKAADRAGLPKTVRPYDLRHAFCSLLIAEGRSIVEIAGQMGHAPTMTLDTYGHVIAELDGGEKIPAEQVIHAARSALTQRSSEADATSEPVSNDEPVQAAHRTRL